MLFLAAIITLSSFLHAVNASTMPRHDVSDLTELLATEAHTANLSPLMVCAGNGLVTPRVRDESEKETEREHFGMELLLLRVKGRCTVAGSEDRIV